MQSRMEMLFYSNCNLFSLTSGAQMRIFFPCFCWVLSVLCVQFCFFSLMLSSVQFCMQMYDFCETYLHQMNVLHKTANIHNNTVTVVPYNLTIGVQNAHWLPTSGRHLNNNHFVCFGYDVFDFLCDCKFFFNFGNLETNTSSEALPFCFVWVWFLSCVSIYNSLRPWCMFWISLHYTVCTYKHDKNIK